MVTFKPLETFKEKTEREVSETLEAQKEELRQRRAAECWPVVNRGLPWYESITPEQNAELEAWYKAWKEVTVTLEAPELPDWI